LGLSSLLVLGMGSHHSSTPRKPYSPPYSPGQVGNSKIWIGLEQEFGIWIGPCSKIGEESRNIDSMGLARDLDWNLNWNTERDTDWNWNWYTDRYTDQRKRPSPKKASKSKSNSNSKSKSNSTPVPTATPSPTQLQVQR
jgi:hypothetical protein